MIEHSIHVRFGTYRTVKQQNTFERRVARTFAATHTMSADEESDLKVDLQLVW